MESIPEFQVFYANWSVSFRMTRKPRQKELKEGTRNIKIISLGNMALDPARNFSVPNQHSLVWKSNTNCVKLMLVPDQTDYPAVLCQANKQWSLVYFP